MNNNHTRNYCELLEEKHKTLHDIERVNQFIYYVSKEMVDLQSKLKDIENQIKHFEFNACFNS